MHRVIRVMVIFLKRFHVTSMAVHGRGGRRRDGARRLSGGRGGCRVVRHRGDGRRRRVHWVTALAFRVLAGHGRTRGGRGQPQPRGHDHDDRRSLLASVSTTTAAAAPGGRPWVGGVVVVVCGADGPHGMTAAVVVIRRRRRRRRRWRRFADRVGGRKKIPYS